VAQNFETELLIKAGVQGLETIAKLASEIEAAGLDVSKLSEEGLALNKTFNEIDQKQGLIDLFRNQKLAAVEASKAWQDAQESTKTLSQEWQAAAVKADELKAAMEASDDVTKAQKDEYKAAAKEVENYAKAHEQSVIAAGKLKDKYTNLNGELSATRQAMADTGLSTTDLAGQSAELSAQSAAATEALAELNAEAESLSEIAKAKIILGIETDDAALAQIEEINQAYELLRDSGTLSSSELAAATEIHTQRVQELEDSLSDATDETTDFATELGKVTAAAGGLTVAVQAAMQFEAAMAGVKKTVDGSPEQIQALSTEIKQLSIDLGLSSEAVADIAAQGGQLGVPIEQLGEFTEMAGKMSVAFGISADEAAESAAQLANVFGISMQDVEALGDAINTLGNNTAATEPDIINSMIRIGGTSKQFGLAEEQAAALSAAFIALGKTPEVAATAVNGLLTKLQTAQVQGKGFQDALDGIGLSSEQLAKDINANPQEALSNFLETLSELDDQQRAIATFKLFGQEYSDDVNLLVGSLDTYNAALGLTADKNKTAGAMQTEFEAQMSTSAASAARAEASLMALTQTLGQHLLPIVSATASGVAGVAGAINSFAESFPMVTKLLVLVAGAQVAMVALKSTIALAGAAGVTAGASISAGMTRATTSILGANVAAGSLAARMTSLSGLFAVAAGWTIGTAIGDSMYENSSAVRSFGDELGRGVAYLDAIVTDRSFDDVRNNFETSAESAARLAETQKNAVSAADELVIAEEAAANAALEQAEANRQLVNEILITEANVKQMTSALTEMAVNGEANSTAYKNLSNDLTETKTRLEAMHLEAKANNLGELLKSDLDQASEAFKALGLDAQEFATGLSSKTTTALAAFSEVAKLAGNDTTMLARAYSATSEQVGNNVQVQAMLEKQLLASVNGNSQLAAEVKRVAIEQRNAKSAADEQAAALSRLGISMDAVNNAMSASGLEMVTTLRSGVAAIKEQATSADALKVALTQALDTSIAAAKTKADFEAINQTLRDAGVAGKVNADQMKILQAGMQGGATAAKTAADAIAAQTNALSANTLANTYSSNASNDNADAKKRQADATNKAADATEKATQNESASLAFMQQVTGAIKTKISALESMGATTEQTDAAWSKFMDSVGIFEGRKFLGIQDFTNSMKRVDEVVTSQVSSFENAKNRADEMTQALSGSAVTSRDLTDAQHALRQATNANVQGLIRMDEQTLSGLQNAIDGARQRMQGLTDDAKNTADQLEATLAKLKGNDDKAREIEQNRKLADLEEKRREARSRGNREEEAELNRALDLQKQINREEEKRAREQAREEQQREQAAQNRQSSSNNSSASNSGNGRNANNSNSGNNQSASDVAAMWDERIERAKKEAAKQAVDDFMKQLKDEAKRRT
jgi:TP901 family phage tail tape measure protein